MQIRIVAPIDISPLDIERGSLVSGLKYTSSMFLEHMRGFVQHTFEVDYSFDKQEPETGKCLQNQGIMEIYHGETLISKIELNEL